MQGVSLVYVIVHLVQGDPLHIGLIKERIPWIKRFHADAVIKMLKIYILTYLILSYLIYYSINRIDRYEFNLCHKLKFSNPNIFET